MALSALALSSRALHFSMQTTRGSLRKSGLSCP